MGNTVAAASGAECRKRLAGRGRWPLLCALGPTLAAGLSIATVPAQAAPTWTRCCRVCRAFGWVLLDLLGVLDMNAGPGDGSVTANVVHPGMVSTAFGAENPSVVRCMVVPFVRPFMKSPDKGAVASIHVVSAPDVEQVSGLFFAKGEPTSSSTRTYDNATAARLWQVSAGLVGL
jgi:hypothetical protein